MLSNQQKTGPENKNIYRLFIDAQNSTVYSLTVFTMCSVDHFTNSRQVIWEILWLFKKIDIAHL